MKVKTVKTNEGRWFPLQNPVFIKTDEGNKGCQKVYFNGFLNVKSLEFSDGSVNKFTENHMLMIHSGEWRRVDELISGDLFNNGLVLLSITDLGVFPTLDMEVPDVHYYILENGIKSHNTSFICGETSLGIEPFLSNYFVKSLAGIQSTFKNKFLLNLLREKGQDTVETWDSILNNLGSVQHLSFLSKEEKSVFKTASEISPKDIIDLAADRQPYIDMGQSINLFNRPNYSKGDIYKIHKYAFEKGLKTLYYYYAQAHAALEKHGEKWDACESCSD